MKLIALVLTALIGFGACTDKKEEMPVPVNLSVQDLSVAEGETIRPVYLNFQLSGKSNDLVVMNVRTLDGTATAGEDFIEIQNAQVTISPGQLSQSLKIEIIGDEIQEQDEYFTIELSDVAGAIIGAGSVRVTVENDDLNTEFTIPQSGYTTPEAYPGMTLIWQDEFNTAAPDKNFWTFEIGNGSGGWGNNELEYYREENTFIRDGHLVIEARREPYAGFEYTSSRMITRDDFNFTYGRVDIRAVLPKGQGIWPALWMLGKNISQVGWPSCGEIDIMEMVGGGPGKDDTVHGTAHWSQNGAHIYQGDHITLPANESFQNSFHVFSIRWDDKLIRWYMNDQLFYSQDITSSEMTEFHKDFFLIFNLAVGGNWPGSPNTGTLFPQRLIVDYVRVFRQD